MTEEEFERIREAEERRAAEPGVIFANPRVAAFLKEYWAPDPPPIRIEET